MKKIFIKWLKYFFLIGWAIVILLPIITIIIGSFKSYGEFNSTNGIELAINPTLENYKRAIVDGKMISGFINTFILIFFGVLGTVFLGSMLAFTLTRFQFKYRKGVILLYGVVALVPLEVSQVITFKIINTLGIYNSRIAPILLYIGVDMVTLFIYIQMMEKIPKELDKAYILEGGSIRGLYKDVIFPISKNATLTICMLKIISIYNDFYIPYLYMPKEGLNTISQSIFKFMSESKVEWNVICAAVVISIIPMIIFFLILQKKIYNGLIEGSVKG
ncbi:MAG: carbohydrate ABC transporter permease [Clostridium sp.]|uniref:carbohydrate ABC transporter permease n=1 Tax=Clostridium sp. TaxID=1506 RepID=UPI003EE715C0